NFKKEIDDITAQLDSFSARGWQIDSSGAYVLDPLGLDSFKRHRYPFYNEAIALNHQGDALITRATHPLAKLPNVPNIKTREYFSEANAGSRAYALQSILSRNTLRHEAGIGIRARDSLYVTWQAPTEPSNTRGKVSVVAIATKLKSVMDPLLPPAFSFCMIDERGEVLFHSSKLKNLQENLFHETENDLLLDAAVKGRLAIEMSLSYGGKDYAAFAKPVQGQPLYLVTLFDKDYYHVRVILTLSLALLLTFAHFALQGLQLLLLYLTTYRSSKLKLKQFFLFWGRPRVYEPVAHPPAQRAANWKDKLGQMTFRERYNAALASMAIIALTLAVAASLFDKLSIMFTLAFMTVPIHLTTFHYMIFSHDQYGHDARRKKFFLIASAILLSFILGLGLACLNSGAFVALLITQAMIFGTYAINLFHNGVRKLHKIFDPLKPIHRYAIFVFGWLVMISVLPISFYYKVAFDRETQGFERYIQWESNTLMAKRNQLLEEEARQLWAVNNRAGIDQQELMEAYVADANKYGSYFDPAIPGLDKKSFERLSTTPLDSIEFYFRPPVRGPIENSRKILLGNAHDRPLKWFLKRPGTLLLESEDKSIAMSSVVPGFSLLAAKYFLVMVVILAVMFAVVYKIILSGMKYIFGIGRLSSARPAEVEAKKILNALIRPDSKFRIFLIGLPFSGKTGLARQIQQQLRTSDQQDQATAAGLALLANKKEIDFRHYEKDLMLSGKEKLFILKHFEHELNDHSKNEDKLAVLEELQRHDEVKIMISSAVEPDLVIEIYEKKIARLEAEKSERPDDPIRKELSDYRTAFRKWKNLLGGFKILHLPVKSTEIGTPLESELGYGTYLPRLVDYFDKTGDLTEDKILEIGEIASPYYHALWNSFSQHEKRILFDLAKDGFVNTRDITKIRLLIKKGIVVMEDCPRIMNRSFGHFILSVVKEDEELAMNEEVRRKGTWHAVQLVLVITLVSIIVFVAFVQREMIPNLNVTIGAISGLVALLSGFQRMIQAKS
ncbi:MAG TPA: hypothetical protein VD816_04185, partial [Ohtaekwangia sp.]|nr:hypothetical protein [Ohtaekwangia sp.]